MQESTHHTHACRRLSIVLRGVAMVFMTCIQGGAAADCALARIARYVAAPDDVSVQPHKRQRADCDVIYGVGAVRAAST
jgi:hypothetical protein